MLEYIRSMRSSASASSAGSDAAPPFNVVIAAKHPAPPWLTMDAAVKHCTERIGIWQWTSNDQGVAPDLVMAGCGDVSTLETLAAVSIMREHRPDLKIRVVNVVDLMKLRPQTEHPHGLSDMDSELEVGRDQCRQTSVNRAGVREEAHFAYGP